LTADETAGSGRGIAGGDRLRDHLVRHPYL